MLADACVGPTLRTPARRPQGYTIRLLLVALVCLVFGMTQDAMGGANPSVTIDLGQTGPKQTAVVFQILALLTVLSLAPAFFIMVTSFTRLVIVLSVLRQARGTQQVPPNQILISLALFITSVLAGHLFFRSFGKRSLLALAVIPLGIIRNGFRIFVIAMLCVHVNPDMIDSPIHHRGGPIFFMLSLIPFSLLLYILWRLERKNPL